MAGMFVFVVFVAVSSFASWHLRKMTHWEKLRDFEACLGSATLEVIRHGPREAAARSTLADANVSAVKKRD
jgi:hypothetical protein